MNNSKFIYHPPIQREVNNNYNDKRITEQGDIALMCPVCFNMVEATVINNIYTGDILDQVGAFTPEVSYTCECKRCNEISTFIPIDTNIAKTIKILNDKGYYTAFSCEGHIEENPISNKAEFAVPYIYFYLWNDFDVLGDYPLPESWNITIEDAMRNIFTIYDTIVDEVPGGLDNDKYIEWISRSWDKEQRLKDIYDWAVSLPEKDENVRYSEYDYIKVYGNKILEDNHNKVIE